MSLTLLMIVKNPKKFYKSTYNVILIVKNIVFIVPLVSFVILALDNFETKIRVESLHEYRTKINRHDQKKKNYEVYENLKNGLIFIKDDKITYVNHICKDVLSHIQNDDNSSTSIEQQF